MGDLACSPWDSFGGKRQEHTYQPVASLRMAQDSKQGIFRGIIGDTV
jgi:hypothetical protein